MFVMTARVNKKKIVGLLAAVAALIALLIMLLGGGEDTAPTAAPPSMATNDGRVQFLKSFGWEVAASPVESGQVRIPTEQSQIFARYNELQKSQGYDLSQYAGEAVMRYVYVVENYPGATEPVYATLLVHKNQVIGGDVTNTSATGVIQSFRFPKVTEETTEATTPSE